MPGRKTTRKNQKEKKPLAAPFNRHTTMRFKVSLLFLMALLIFGLFLLLFALIGVQGNPAGSRSTAAATGSSANQTPSFGKTELDDAALNFTLEMPAALGDWLYRSGSVKSPVDDTISDKFVSIYVPKKSETATNNFDNLTVSVLTIREFSKKEWNALDKGCKKGKEDYCLALGTKIDEMNDVVYTYTKPETCPAEVQAKCGLADDILRSFSLR